MGDNFEQYLKDVAQQEIPTAPLVIELRQWMDEQIELQELAAEREEERKRKEAEMLAMQEQEEEEDESSEDSSDEAELKPESLKTPGDKEQLVTPDEPQMSTAELQPTVTDLDEPALV